jgi:hypothetical protein
MEELIKDQRIIDRISLKLRSVIGYKPFKLSIAIKDYSEQVIAHYSTLINGDIRMLCQQAEIPYALSFKNFGLIISFEKACKLALQSQDMVLDNDLKDLIAEFGAVIFRNVDLVSEIKELYHRNNFPHLNFHTDRGEAHDNKYSFYTRDPFDDEQKYPRKASTVFIDNAVAYLQSHIEGTLRANETGRRGHYSIFKHDGKETDFFGNLILEQRWSEPEGTGEICMINNLTVLHSSYKHGFDHGYRIGARYLA